MLLEIPLLTSSILTTGVVFFAEIGDKSQLVCMTLAARHRTRPILIGAISAFLLLNLLAVTLGATLATWLPTQLITALAAALFALFGIQALMYSGDDEEETDLPKAAGKRSIVVTTFMMILVAELGDKTQLAVASLGSTEHPLGVWIGASLALTATTALGIFAGRKLLTRLNPRWIHRISGAFFIVIAILATARLL